MVSCDYRQYEDLMRLKVEIVVPACLALRGRASESYSSPIAGQDVWSVLSILQGPHVCVLRTDIPCT